ncbi:flagellar motor protein MotB [Mesorhizobium sp. Root157]|uniref:MotB family protein n=1 Tax=Mesorhizobium sp. Root157 TaxID=1736477 RepID=UPI0006F4FC07|nr:MotB family protein [Mesorhizobium sp. Root157]KQZ87000.1 flagellar motor protein MotB [Mesorhizobium sp. Root157]
MTMAENANDKHEIIIVRRGHSDEEEGHHGGVWKIAFADFMTAMMCFFLVMWLINAANEQTRAAVASYFNPIRLVDRNANRKGLEDLGNESASSGMAADSPQNAATKTGQDGEGNAGSVKEQNKEEEAAAQTFPSDEKLFADPYAVLAEIVANSGKLQNISEKGDGGAQAAGPATGASGGQSYRDPFAPDFWSQQMTTPGAEASAARAKIEGDPAKPDDKVAEFAAPKTKAETAAESKPAPESLPQPVGAPSAKQGDSDLQRELAKIEAPKLEPVERSPANRDPSAATVEASERIKTELATALSGDKVAEGLTVEATDKGVVISITDQLDFGMFEIGSAVPRRDLVLAMEKIGRVINGQKGNLSIQGHTDARPFRSDTYDNWRLSSARAHAAYYMLVRGGVDEGRIREVAGFADRDPKDKADPLSAVNRRIAILLETDG